MPKPPKTTSKKPSISTATTSQTGSKPVSIPTSISSPASRPLSKSTPTLPSRTGTVISTTLKSWKNTPASARLITSKKSPPPTKIILSKNLSRTILMILPIETTISGPSTPIMSKTKKTFTPSSTPSENSTIDSGP